MHHRIHPRPGGASRCSRPLAIRAAGKGVRTQWISDKLWWILLRSMGYDVFVSYRWVEPDKSWVQKELVPALQSAGLDVCLDVNDFVPGRDLILEMTRAGRESKRMLCVISPDYFEGNRFAGFESLMALRNDPTGARSGLIPMIIRKTSIADHMKGPVPVDWTEEANLGREWTKLLSALEAPDIAIPAPGMCLMCVGERPAPQNFRPRRGLFAVALVLAFLTWFAPNLLLNAPSVSILPSPNNQGRQADTYFIALLSGETLVMAYIAGAVAIARRLTPHRRPWGEGGFWLATLSGWAGLLALFKWWHYKILGAATLDAPILYVLPGLSLSYFGMSVAMLAWATLNDNPAKRGGP